jgi:hypothetical protein
MNRSFVELENAIQQAGYESRRALISAEVPVEQLLVYLGQDNQEHFFFLQLLFAGDLQPYLTGGEDSGFLQENDYLQFYCQLPFQPLTSAFPDLARLVLRINLVLPGGEFGLNEATPAVYCRQVLPCPGGRVDPQAVAVTVLRMAFAIEKHFPDLLAVGSGEKTLADLEK